MKKIISIALLIIPGYLSAQTTPKIRIQKGVFSDRYELGEVDTSTKKIGQHLKTSDIDAYLLWNDADKAETSALVWSILGLGGTLVGVLAQDSNNKVLGYGAAAVGFGGTFICTLKSGAKRKRSIQHYNLKFGY